MQDTSSTTGSQCDTPKSMKHTHTHSVMSQWKYDDDDDVKWI